MIMLKDTMSQYLKKLFKLVSVRKSKLKFCTVTCSKDLHQTPRKSDICRRDFKLHFEMYACPISFQLLGENETLRAIVLIFVSIICNFSFHSH